MAEDFQLDQLQIQPGFYSNSTDRTAEGRWKGGDHVRFAESLPEKIGGYVDAGDIIPEGVVRAAIDWVDLTANKWMAIGTSQKLYLYDMTTLYDITPYEAQGYLQNPFSVTDTSDIVTVADTAHGREVGDHVHFSGAVTVGGIDPNGEWVVSEVADLNTYKFVAGSVASSTVSNAGDETGTLGTNPFQTFNGTPTVRVTDTAHARLVGDVISFSGATNVATVVMNGTWTVATLIDADHYEFTAGSNANANATGGGAAVAYDYRVRYFYEIGVEQAYVASGWSRGSWSSGAWNEDADASDDLISFLNPLRIWSLDNWGEDLLASPRGGAVYWWDRTNGPNVRAQLVATVPDTNNRMAVNPDNRIMSLYGTDDTGGGFDPMLVRWSDQEDFTDVTGGISGDFRLSYGSRIITAIKSKRETLVFTDTAVYSQQYVGGTDIYDFNPIATNVTIMGPGAGCDVNGVVFFMSTDNFMIYDGVMRPIPCDVWQSVFPQVSFQYKEKIVCAANRKFSEVWWIFPTGSASEPDHYAIFNYKDNNWVTGTIDRTFIHDYSSFFGKPYGFTAASRLLKHETGVDDVDANGDAISLDSYIESYDVDIGSGENLLHIDRMLPDFSELTGTGLLYLAPKQYPQQGVALVKGPYTVTGASFVSVRGRGRQIALKFTLSDLGSVFRMGAWRVRGRPHGQR